MGLCVIITKYPEKYKEYRAAGGEVYDDKVYNSHPDYLVKKFGYGRDYKELYGKYSGSCAIVGMGPSRGCLNGRKLAIPSFSINKAAVEYLDSTYWVAHDPTSLLHLGSTVPARTPLITYGYNVYREHWDKRGEREVFFYDILDDPRRSIYRPLYWNESGFGLALNLVHRIGFTTIYVIGIDMTTGGYTSYAFHEDEMLRQHEAVAKRIRRMFTDEEKPKWNEGKSLDIIDLGAGNLPVKHEKPENAPIWL